MDIQKLNQNAESIDLNEEKINEYKLSKEKISNYINSFLNENDGNNIDTSAINVFTRKLVIKLINNEDIQLQLIYNKNYTTDFDTYDFTEIIGQFRDETKLQILQDTEFVKRIGWKCYEISNILSNCGDEIKLQALSDKKMMRKLKKYDISSLIKSMESDEMKIKSIKMRKLDGFYLADIINSMKDEKMRLETFLKFEKKIPKMESISIMSNLDIESLEYLIKKQPSIFEDNDINIYEVSSKMDEDKQIELFQNIENMGLTLNEKREILVSFREDTKEQISNMDIPEEYRMAISIKMKIDSIDIDLSRNMEDYIGMDRLLRIYPQEMDEKSMDKIMQLCEVCPNTKVLNSFKEGICFESNGKEYLEAEKWISDLLNNLNPEYSDLQKMAVIDNAIGKKISYSPDFSTEVFDNNDCRALWKVISSEYGVCNGIANVEKYIFDRIGIESETVSSENHTFLKIKNIEIPSEDGKILKGNTILDPTWNLSMQRFGGRPDNFCISYEEARKKDIDEDGKDHKCHENNKELQDANLSLEDKMLRKIYTSVGLADKDGIFLAKDLIEESEKIHEKYKTQPEQNILEQFSLLKNYCQEFASCQNSTISILSDVLLNSENLEFDKCEISRVYDKSDEDKRPIMYVYISSDELGKKFYFANQDTNEFEELPQEKFVDRFECYEMDLEKSKGIRPWETKEQNKKEIDLSKNSGHVLAKEGEER